MNYLALLLVAVSRPVEEASFERVAAGVWRATVGQPEALSLLSVAGGEPRQAALSAMGETEFPFDEGQVNGFSENNRCALRLPLAPQEEIYGLGLDFHKVRRRGSIQTLRVDHWGGTSGRTHAPVPFYVSDRGYGVLVDSARYLTFYVGTSLRQGAEPPPEVRDRNRDSDWQAHPPSDSIDVHVPAGGATVYVFAGPTALDAVRRYVLFSGGGCLPPKWGLGFTHRTPTRYTDQQLLAEVAEFEERGFPLDFVGVEPGWHSHAYPCSFEWDAERFPDPGAFVAKLLAKGVRVNLWMNPYVCPGTKLHRALAPFAASHHVWNGIVPDYEIAEARDLFLSHLQGETVAIGVSGFKVDEVDGYDRWLWPDVTRFPSGNDAEQMRQTYGVRLQRMLEEAYRSHDRRTFGLVRASNAGASRFPFVIYNDHYSHQDFITALVNSSFCGVLWTPEVRGSKSGEEWLRRMQTVCFSPMAMLNAWASGTKPWSFEEVTEEVREIALLRMRLLPYLYTAFARYAEDGTPPIRAMPLVPGFSEAGTATERRAVLKTQFLVGEDLLVAPLFTGESSRQVVLPKGRWFDFWTGKESGNGEAVTVQPADHRIPVFVRNGALIPLMEARLHAPRPGEKVPLEVRHYGEQPGEFRLYDDDGETFAFERGACQWTSLNYQEDADGVWLGTLRGEASESQHFSYDPVIWLHMESKAD